MSCRLCLRSSRATLSPAASHPVFVTDGAHRPRLFSLRQRPSSSKVTTLTLAGDGPVPVGGPTRLGPGSRDSPSWSISAGILVLTDLTAVTGPSPLPSRPGSGGFHAIPHSAEEMAGWPALASTLRRRRRTRGLPTSPSTRSRFAEGPLFRLRRVRDIQATFIHATVRINSASRPGRVLATPRFHHWHLRRRGEAVASDFSFPLPVPRSPLLHHTNHSPSVSLAFFLRAAAVRRFPAWITGPVSRLSIPSGPPRELLAFSAHRAYSAVYLVAFP